MQLSTLIVAHGIFENNVWWSGGALISFSESTCLHNLSSRVMNDLVYIQL